MTAAWQLRFRSFQARPRVRKVAAVVLASYVLVYLAMISLAASDPPSDRARYILLSLIPLGLIALVMVGRYWVGVDREERESNRLASN